MKSYAGIVLMAALALGSVAPVVALADPAQSADSAAIDALAAKIVAVAQSTEATAKAAAATDDEVKSQVAAAVGGVIQAAVANGATSAEVSQALVRAMNTKGISKTLKEAFVMVQDQLATLLGTTPGAVGGTAAPLALPAAPAPAPGGAGYTG